MGDHGIIYIIFVVFTGAALLATLALYARQALIVAYIVLGTVMGPGGLGLIADPQLVQGMSDIGIVFLLFLLGLSLLPQKLATMLKEAMVVTLVSSAVFAGGGAAVAMAMGFGLRDSMIVGACMMFSSTIIGLKLLPTTALHHRRAGEIIISVLLIQDVIAIVLMLGLQSSGADFTTGALRIALGLPGLVVLAIVLERYVIRPLLLRFDQIKEYVFLLSIGWCMACAQFAETVGLSYEIGAFVAGVSLATSPISRYIAESLRPLRDFFLVLFFFALGTNLSPDLAAEVALPALLLAALMLAIKPPVFAWLLKSQEEKPGLAREMGVRLGQVSEFSLLVAAVATSNAVIQSKTAHLIELTVVITFMVSSFWVVRRYPTPIATSEDLRRD